MAFDASQFMYNSGSDYEINNSLRFDKTRQCELHRTPGSAGNRKTMTWNFWVKRSGISTDQQIFTAARSTPLCGINFPSNNTFQMTWDGAGDGHLKTTQVFRDTSAWYNFHIIVDTREATAADRVEIYVNGVRVTEFDTENYPPQNKQGAFGNTVEHNIGAEDSANPFNGYLADIHYVNGSVLAPTVFGKFNEYGQWVPVSYDGTYGTTGYHLEFAVATIAATGVGLDTGGSSNNWIPTSDNLIVADQVLDTPTNNFPTWNILDNHAGLVTEGALKIIGNSSQSNMNANDGMFTPSTLEFPKTGKWYWECKILDQSYRGQLILSDVVGLADFSEAQHFGANTWNGTSDSSSTNTASAQGGAGSDDEIVAFAFDADGGSLWWSSDSAIDVTTTAEVTSIDAPNGGYRFMTKDTSGNPHGDYHLNFGQDSTFSGTETAGAEADSNGRGDFFFAPPDGYLAVCTQNFPSVSVIPNENFSAEIWSGNDTNGRAIPVNFQPDFIWIKSKSGAQARDPHVTDVVRGAGKSLRPSVSAQEQNNGSGGFVSGFTSTGFTLGNGSSNNKDTNKADFTYVGWCWKTGASAATLTAGNINSSVSAGTEIGFSIATYTGIGGEPKTVAHGLSKAPEMVMIKKRAGADANWVVWHQNLTANYAFEGLNTDGLQVDGGNNPSKYVDAVSSTLVTLGDAGEVNANTHTYVMYSWHEVAGYSRFGKFEGNGNADGCYVTLGFRPAFVMTKSMDSTSNWEIFDNKRLGYNADNNAIYQNSAGGQQSADQIDFLSDGFKLRIATDPNVAETYIYMAFAETPAKHSNAR